MGLQKICPKGMGMGTGKAALKDLMERANVELLGFVGFLLDIPEEQICLEKGETGSVKTLKLRKVKQDKRELIWNLQAKVGQRHEAHFQEDNLNLLRQEMGAGKRRKEQDEFQSLREEMISAP